MNGIDTAFLIGIFMAIIAQSTILWRQLGKVETGITDVRNEQKAVAKSLEEAKKKVCPFPSCPVFVRAIDEAAPTRDVEKANFKPTE